MKNRNTLTFASTKIEKLYIQVSGMDKRLIIGLICLFGVCLLSAQDRKSEPDKKKKRVDLLYADEAQADKQLRPDVQVLIGSVRMKHDSMYMFCDSALIYEKSIP